MRQASRFIRTVAGAFGGREAYRDLVVNNYYQVTHVHCNVEQCPYDEADVDDGETPQTSAD